MTAGLQATWLLGTISTVANLAAAAGGRHGSQKSVNEVFAYLLVGALVFLPFGLTLVLGKALVRLGKDEHPSGFPVYVSAVIASLLSIWEALAMSERGLWVPGLAYLVGPFCLCPAILAFFFLFWVLPVRRSP
jgi:hypothetical protein